MLQMGFQDLVTGRTRYRYAKLSSFGEKVTKPARQCWVKKTNGRLRGLRLSRSKKLTLKVFSMVVLTSRIARMYNEAVHRFNIHGVSPNTVFYTHWGLPVLSHSSIICRKNAVSVCRS